MSSLARRMAGLHVPDLWVRRDLALSVGGWFPGRDPLPPVMTLYALAPLPWTPGVDTGSIARMKAPEVLKQEGCQLSRYLFGIVWARNKCLIWLSSRELEVCCKSG